MSLLSTRGEEREVLETPGSRMEIYRVGSAVLVTHVKGHAIAKHVQRLIARSDDLIARAGRISVVHDWFEVSGYESEVRTTMTPWALKTRAAHAGIHIGSTAAIVQMGVTMVRLASGAPIHAYKTLASLEVALGDALRVHREKTAGE